MKSFLTEIEFAEWKERLQNILDLNQNRLKANGKLDKENAEIARRIEQSKEFGSLCLEPELKGEIWKSYKAGKTEGLEVSSYGRVRYSYNKEIIPQKDSEEKGKEVGYLVLDNAELPKIHVYQMVAETFLEKPDSGEYQIHHITNNGYDNSVGNLIYLTKEQHNQLNH